MEYKRGQLTIFVIVGVVIIVGLIAFFVYQGNGQDRFFSQDGIKEDISEIEDYMKECATFVTEQGLLAVASQGGYFEAPPKVDEMEEGGFIPYYSYESEYYVPSLKTIEVELGKAIDSEMGQCLDIAEFTGYDVSYRSLSTNVIIQDGYVDFIIDMPVVIEREDHTMIIEMKERPVTQKMNLKGMHNVASYYVDDLKDDGLYCLDCIDSLANANDVDVDIVSLSPLVGAVIIQEEDDKGEWAYFVFLNKFSQEQYDSARAPFALGDLE